MLIRIRFRLLCFFFCSILVCQSLGAPTVPEGALRDSLLRGQWNWDGLVKAYPPVDLEFRADGNGKSERFTYVWTVTGEKTVTLKMDNGGKKMEWELTFNDSLTAFEAREVRMNFRARGTLRSVAPVSASATPRSTPVPLPPAIAASTTAPTTAIPQPATRPSTPLPLPTSVAATPRPATPTPPTVQPISGIFHLYIDDTLQLFLNGRQILNVQNRWFRTQTQEVAIKPGDRLVAQLCNTGGGRAFVIGFASSDQQKVVHFSNTSFRVLANPTARDFTPAEFHAGRMAEEDHQHKEEPPFWFKSRSEWVWGKGEVTTIGAIITGDMFQPLRK